MFMEIYYYLKGPLNAVDLFIFIDQLSRNNRFLVSGMVLRVYKCNIQLKLLNLSSERLATEVEFS